MSNPTYDVKPEDLFFNLNDETYCVEDMAVAKLLVDGQLVVLPNGEGEERTLGIFVNCSDIFYLASADCECIKNSDELTELIKMHFDDPKWGTIKWVSIKRNMRPHKYIIKMMKKAGSWDNTMESLPK